MLLLYEYRTKTVVLRIMNLPLMKFSLLPSGLKHTPFFKGPIINCIGPNSQTQRLKFIFIIRIIPNKTSSCPSIHFLDFMFNIQ